MIDFARNTIHPKSTSTSIQSIMTCLQRQPSRYEDVTFSVIPLSTIRCKQLVRFALLILDASTECGHTRLEPHETALEPRHTLAQTDDKNLFVIGLF